MMYRLIGRRLALCLFTGLIPLGAAATMALPGAFGVDQGGAATYAIPIQAPPGTAGVEPALALTYNSQNGNGLLGMGWALSGLSSITRCAGTTWADGYIGGINLDANDRFCLDGQRLVLASPATYGDDWTEYRTERDGFTKVMSFGNVGSGPAWFKVWTKSGQILDLGNTPDSQFILPGKTAVLTWAVNKAKDAKGNYLNVTYTKEAANGNYYPKQIDYTGNTTTALTPKNSVRFSYADRPDIENAAVAKAFVTQTKRLTNIQAYHGSTLVHDYRLAYQTGGATGRSHLTSVTQCDGAATPLCLPTLRLNWQDATPATLTPGTWLHTTQDFSTNPDGSLNLLALDLNGDGKTDLLQQWNNNGTLWLRPYFANGTGYTEGIAQNTGQPYLSTGPKGPGLLALDLNGDGKMDIVQQRNNNGVLSLLFYVSTGTGFTVGAWQDKTSPYAKPYLSSGPDGPGLIALDYNGDGVADLVQRWVDNGILYLVPYISGVTANPSVNTGVDANWAAPSPVIIDLNADGKQDLVLLQKAGGSMLNMWPLMANGNDAPGGFTLGNATVTSQPFPDRAPKELGVTVLDINGDGKMDLVSQVNVSGTLWLYPYLSDGGGTVSSGGGGQFKVGTGFNTGQPFVSGPSNGPGLLVLDLNGDGKMDLVQQWNNNGTLWLLPYLANGAGFAAGAPINTGQPFLSGGANGPGLLVADLNGDGKQELVQQWNNNGKLSLLPYLAGGATPDLVTAIDSGLGASTTIAYKPLADSSVYTRDGGVNAAVYPMVDLQTPVNVVASVTSPDGIGGTRTTGYTYGGLKHNWQRKERQGFRWVQSIQAETGLVSRTDYRQDFPYSGLATLNTQTLPGSGNNGLLKQIANIYGCTDIVAGGLCNNMRQRYFTYLSQSTVNSWDLNGAVLPTTTTTAQYDSYGNPTQTAVSSSDGHSTTTVNTYKADTVNWTIRQLTRSTVTSTAP